MFTWNSIRLIILIVFFLSIFGVEKYTLMNLVETSLKNTQKAFNDFRNKQQKCMK